MLFQSAVVLNIYGIINHFHGKSNERNWFSSTNGKCPIYKYKNRFKINKYKLFAKFQMKKYYWPCFRKHHVLLPAALVGIMNVVVRMMEYWHQVKMVNGQREEQQ